MKYSHLMSFVLIASFLYIDNVASATNAGAGMVSMGGEIHESACSIHTDDVWQEIPFNEVTHRSISDETTTVTQPVKIRLINCSLDRKNGSLWSNVAMTFDGERDATSPDLFTVHGSAEGIGLRITNSSGKNTKPGESLPPEDISEGDNELKYTLNLVNNGNQLKEGDWFSVIRFVVAYQ
jgi:type 1 fimbria pilin